MFISGGAVLLKACLNGGTTRREHPSVPQTPAELALEDGRPASGNSELVQAAARLIAEI